MPFIRFNSETEPNKRYFSSISNFSIFTCPSHRAQERELQAAKSIADHIFDLAKKGSIAPVFQSAQVVDRKSNVLYDPAREASAPAPVTEEPVPTSVIAWDGTARIVPVADIEHVGPNFWRYKYFFKDRRGNGRMGEITGKSKLSVVEKLFDVTWCLGQAKLQDDLRELALTFAIDTNVPEVKREPTTDELQRVAPMSAAFYDATTADVICEKCIGDRLILESFKKFYAQLVAADSRIPASKAAALTQIKDPEYLQLSERLATAKACMDYIAQQIAIRDRAAAADSAANDEAQRRLGGTR